MGEVVIYQDFFERKVEQCILLWKYGKHDDAVFAYNMERIGFNKKDIQECLNEYHNED